MKPIIKKSPGQQFKELADLVTLGRKMRAAQIAYEEKRGYGTLTRLPLQVKAEKLEAEFDKALRNYPET